MSANNLKTHSETDWARIDSMMDEEIDTSDIPPLEDAFFSRAQWRVPRGCATNLWVASIPPTAVGGSFKPSLHRDAVTPSEYPQRQLGDAFRSNLPSHPSLS